MKSGEHSLIVSYAAIERLNNNPVGEHDLVIRCKCGWKSDQVFNFGQNRKIRREYAKHLQ